MWFCSNHLFWITWRIFLLVLFRTFPRQLLMLFSYWCVLKEKISKILKTNYFHHQLWWNDYIINLFPGLNGENWTSGFLKIMNSKGSRKNRELGNKFPSSIKIMCCLCLDDVLKLCRLFPCLFSSRALKFLQNRKSRR